MSWIGTLIGCTVSSCSNFASFWLLVALHASSDNQAINDKGILVRLFASRAPLITVRQSGAYALCRSAAWNEPRVPIFIDSLLSESFFEIMLRHLLCSPRQETEDLLPRCPCNLHLFWQVQDLPLALDTVGVAAGS